MGHAGRPQKVKLIAGLLIRDTELLPKIKSALVRVFGKTDFESDIIDFTHTDYYKEEMGTGLKRKFLSFSRLQHLKDIYKIKSRTNVMEGRFSISGNRLVNIDPGYIDLAKLVLFSTKDYSHRVYLHGGIYAEVTLYFKEGNFRPWPWTYPDYKSDRYIKIFNRIRGIYKQSL